MLTHPARRAPTYAEAVMAAKPLRYHRLREHGGLTTLIDEAGLVNGTVTGTPTRMAAAGPPGIADARGFQTTNASGGFATAGTGAWPTTAYTIAAWAFVTAQVSPDTGIFGRWQNGVGAMLYKPNNTTILFLHRGTSLSSGTLPLSTWQFLTGTWDGSNLRFYVNGVLKAGPTANSTAPGNAGSWTFNTYTVVGDNTIRIMTGTTAECVVWDRALSQGEIANLNAIGWGQ